MPGIRTIARAFPTLTLALDIPTRPDDVARRHHNRMTKDALREVLEEHHQTRLPEHFSRAAHAKYGYAQRNEKYIRTKQRRYHTGGLDLVKTGGSRARMAREGHVVMSGAAEGSQKKLGGTLKLRFDFRGGSGRYRQPGAAQHIPIDQMRKEVRTFLAAERAEMARSFRAKYLAAYKAFRARRQRVRMPTT
jgi:hypothetical protein